ncbi:MAG: lysoplasmalogenase [Pyrinomonadaceae bacterium]|nr:lysoplasmalogenase [Pyrinomonadaceae bacterium]MBP6213011.1 lysoplasmalogenase [Pyrinomonadaceae bacterium]
MFQDNTTIILAAICLTGAVISVIGEWKKWEVTRSVAKLTASTAFVVLAGVNGAPGSNYGRLIMTALIFSWLGDAFLLSIRRSFLLAGIAAFLFAHVAFAIAFASQPINFTWLIIAFVVLIAASAAMMRWLWPNLEKFYKLAVPVYLIAISIMTALAVAVSAASGSWLLAAAAIVFAASDVSVARDRFIERSIANKAWGLPLYFIAQIMFAMSVLLYR